MQVKNKADSFALSRAREPASDKLKPDFSDEERNQINSNLICTLSCSCDNRFIIFVDRMKGVNMIYYLISGPLTGLFE